MTNKTISTLTFLVATGLLIIFGRSTLIRYQMQQPNEYLNAIRNIKADDLVRIEIAKNSRDLVLTKQEGRWKVASKTADLAKVNELIRSLLTTVSPQIISQNKDKFEELELATGSATIVKLISLQKETSFIVGKQIGSDTVVVLQDLDKAFSLASVPSLSETESDWIDKTIIDIDSLQIKQLIFEGSGSYALNQTSDRQWAFEDSSDKVNSDGVNTFLYKFNPFKGDDLASEEQKQKADLASNGFNIILTDKGDNKTDLNFRLVEDEYIVKRSTDNEYFVISKTTGESFDKNKTGFISSSN